MADEAVREAQQWVNATYKGVNGYTAVAEDGITGFATIKALTKGLQHELGDAKVDGIFGDGTLAKLTAQFPVVNENTTNKNVRIIVQCAMYCKGYDGGGTDGIFGATTKSGISRLTTDMGLGGGIGITPKVFRGLLTMDAYVVTSGGTEAVRRVQQWLNATYTKREKFMIIPCDGNFSRDVQKALVRALQFELGQSDAAADGIYGAGTASGIKAQAVLSVGSADTAKKFVRLFQAAMIFNDRTVPFDGSFTASTSSSVSEFQRFMVLPVTGKGDFQTWAALLVSTGDAERPGTGADTRFPISSARAAKLYAAGYRVVGRYLTNATSAGAFDKKIQPGETTAIFDNKLRLFPIFQTYGGHASYFTREQGERDGVAAYDAAQEYGFHRGTIIYFAVDYDAIDEEISSTILAYFTGVVSALRFSGSKYLPGVYGSRNVCLRVSRETGISRSFVSGMSTGFSGNLGYPMPDNWAFNQIKEFHFEDPDPEFRIDKSIVSGRDQGQSSVSAPAAHDTAFDAAYTTQMTNEIVAWFDQNMTGPQKAVAIHLDRAANVKFMLQFDALTTRLSRSYNMKKALIQTVLLWEYCLQNRLDAAADVAVKDYYVARMAGITPPSQLPDDSSTGVCQIFARTAIDATNFAVGKGIYSSRTFDAANWRDVWQMWQNLQEEAGNIAQAALVLIRAANQAGVGVDYWNFSAASVRAVLARYNGTNADATEYGRRNYGLYTILEKYNALSRS
ncbi:DUF1906 domain-containing protein [Saxibacter everestensis]|uniref:DUF1906 domain-containing protein n=1 Tax=Saxibacter everestensis TaxID=2909229 RepID=A0ABY8QU14_9MICO|nr:DUF1906 domain-containing protein [Brevibacteriaceae bacterium ZFBP1038]